MSININYGGITNNIDYSRNTNQTNININTQKFTKILFQS